jgi:cyclophilin family peptidyl-prolyl cis-trans isomerase
VLIGQALSWSLRPQPSGAFARCHTARQLSPRVYAAPPAMCIDPKRSYSGTIHTTKGDVTVTFLTSVAPQTVNNFIVLAANGYFDGLRFFRHGTFYWQTGDPNEDGTGGPGYTLPDEDTSSQPFFPGSLGMARFADGLSGGQFFITTADWPGDGPPAEFNHFATVTLGTDVLGQLTTDDRITGIDLSRT